MPVVSPTTTQATSDIHSKRPDGGGNGATNFQGSPPEQPRRRKTTDADDDARSGFGLSADKDCYESLSSSMLSSLLLLLLSTQMKDDCPNTNTRIVASSSSTLPAPQETIDPKRCTERCIRLLQHVLTQDESKPSQLLQSMQQQFHSTNVAWRKTETGIEVQIPHANQLRKVEKEDYDDVGGVRKIIETDPDQNPGGLLRRLSSKESSNNHEVSYPNKKSNADTSIVSATKSVPTELAISSRADETSSIQQHQSHVSTSNPLEWMSLQCRPCKNHGPEANARAFVMGPTPLSVIVCSNRLPAGTVTEMNQILTHELVHIFDVRLLEMDLLRCENLAYSEIRAAREAECAITANSEQSSSWMFGRSTLSKQEQCVRTKAVTATRTLFPMQAQQCLDAVFERAYQDVRPFHKTKENDDNKQPCSNR